MNIIVLNDKGVIERTTLGVTTLLNKGGDWVGKNQHANTWSVLIYPVILNIFWRNLYLQSSDILSLSGLPSEGWHFLLFIPPRGGGNIVHILALLKCNWHT